MELGRLGSRVFRAGSVLRMEDPGVCCWMGYRGILSLLSGWVGKMEFRCLSQGGSDGLCVLVVDWGAFRGCKRLLCVPWGTPVSLGTARGGGISDPGLKGQP